VLHKPDLAVFSTPLDWVVVAGIPVAFPSGLFIFVSWGDYGCSKLSAGSWW